MSELSEAIQTYVKGCVAQGIMTVAHEIASRHKEFVVVSDRVIGGGVVTKQTIEPMKLAEVISDAAQKLLSQRG